MMDLVLELWVSSLIEVVKMRGAQAANHSWTPGEKLKLLLMAYNGARNTGEDVRVEEMVRQFRRISLDSNGHCKCVRESWHKQQD